LAEASCWIKYDIRRISFFVVRSAPALDVHSRLRKALVSAYGNILVRAVLFDSRARGDAQSDSYYDVAVFLRRPEGLWAESGRLADITADILDQTGAVVNALPFPAGAIEARTPLSMSFTAMASIFDDTGGARLSYQSFAFPPLEADRPKGDCRGLDQSPRHLPSS
jgi:hypothetical protein